MKETSATPRDGNERSAACDNAPEDAERKGLGIPAASAAIIKKLIKTGFIERVKNTLTPTAKDADCRAPWKD